jgi:hypothetical protein
MFLRPILAAVLRGSDNEPVLWYIDVRCFLSIDTITYNNKILKILYGSEVDQIYPPQTSTTNMNYIQS